MAGPVTVACPVCRQAFPIPTEVVGVDHEHNTVLVTMDRSELYGHLRTCAAEHGDQAGQEHDDERDKAKDQHPAGKALERPAAPIPVAPGLVAKGNRPCTMCGTSSPDCMTSLANSLPCCGACGEGNTHPSRHESTPCAQWAAEHLTRES